MRLFANIILPLPLQQYYTYLIPTEMESCLQIGSRVIVPFGKSKKYTGIIIHLHHEVPSIGSIKAIEALLDPEAIVTPQQLQFWEWISAYYLCSMGEVFKAALPSGLKLESETEISLNEMGSLEGLNEQELLVIQTLNNKNTHSIDQLNKVLGLNNSLPLMKRMLDKNLIQISQAIQSNYQSKKEKRVSFTSQFTDTAAVDAFLEANKRFKVQQDLLTTLLRLMEDKASNSISKSLLLKESGASESVLKSLEKKGIIQTEERVIRRSIETDEETFRPHPLNKSQQQAIGGIINSFKTHDVCLLHGVTSSGKTEVYIHLIEEALSRHQQVLYLVPEIALTPQITKRLQRVFGARLGVYHSKFSDAERVELWQKQIQPELANDIILGVRSSIFLPFHRLGLVIVDEEHEASYKQYDPNPRYHARDLAIVLAKQFNRAKVLLGSATPSIESYYNALTDKFGLVTMKERHQDVSMPEVQTVNMAETYHRKDHISNFSAVLLHEIELALSKQEQVILFQNRRGFSAYVECNQCGYVPKCKHCDVSLTYYQHSQRLTCHYCGYGIGSEKKCPQCSKGFLQSRGFGTEKIESELKELFLDARIQRMDLDTTRNKHAYEQIIQQFEDHQFDILVGTQMVSKGLDFADVHVVGIMNADNMLNFPDFRAFERAYQLMVQVSGRAGRSKKKGLVILQTHDPDHPIIQYVMNNNYVGMYEEQIKERELFRYPPFYRLIKVTLQHANKSTLNSAMNVYANSLKQHLGNRVLGPEWPVINRIKNKFSKCLLVKIERNASLVQIKACIMNEIKKLQLEKNWSSIRAIIDVDPM